MRMRSGRNSESYRWVLLLLQQNLVATGSRQLVQRDPTHEQSVSATCICILARHYNKLIIWQRHRISERDAVQYLPKHDNGHFITIRCNPVDGASTAILGNC